MTSESDLELGITSTPVKDNIEEEERNPQSQCRLRFSGISKSVEIVEEKSGLIRGKKKSNTGAASTKQILKNVSGSALSGEVMAIIGPSGSGKTSLLDALSGRSSYSEGKIYLNGVEVVGSVMKRMKRRVAYVKQADLFFDHLTVKDQLMYTALLRLPSSEDRNLQVNRILQMLRLEKCADTPIRLISGGEKKRVNIGTELLSSPRIIMLDEPTSGLDSTSAVALMNMLHELAKNSATTIITSIHQPTSAVFRAFDRLLVLADGSVVYHGTPLHSLTHLRSLNLTCPDGYNAADHWMDLLVHDSAIDTLVDTNISEAEDMEDEKKEEILPNHSINTRAYLIKSWDADEHQNRVSSEAAEDLARNDKDDAGGDILVGNSQKYVTTWSHQFLVLMNRSMRNSRAAIFTPLNVFKSAALGTFMGLLWFQLPYTEKAVHDRVSYYFFTMTFWVFDSMFGAVMTFPGERRIINRERSSGSYHLSAYFLAKSCSEAPTRLTLPAIYMCISFWLVGISNKIQVFAVTVLCTLLSVMAGESYGLVVSAAVTNLEKAIVVMTLLGLTLMVMGGFFIQNVPSYAVWIKFISPFKYSFDASQQMIFDKNVPCDGSRALEICGGLDVGHVTPEEMMEHVILSQGSVGFNLAMLLVLFSVPRYIAYLCLRQTKTSQRNS